MNKYNVGDVVKFTKENGSYVNIKNYGTIKQIEKRGYIILCYDLNSNQGQSLYFYEDEIIERMV